MCILLLDLNKRKHWGRELRRILENGSGEDFTVRYVPLHVSGTATVANLACSAASETGADETFLVLDQDSQGRRLELVRKMRARFAALPIVVVLRTQDPQEIIMITGGSSMARELCARVIVWNSGVMPPGLAGTGPVDHQAGSVTASPGVTGDADGSTMFLDKIDTLYLRIPTLLVFAGWRVLVLDFGKVRWCRQ
jgi:hypothetical protein